uniref:Protein transport protein SEC23 n=1 Tax=Hanusia phi TaxID=3032 RepID=A0A7S0EQM2_9CRYP|mmetsp:Transcript_27428/g.62162  ORF Transcript_27428/g.62162 Transcript_27428/m.62162 type:complete len:737 (+) Transcript_27428:80-2290(+)
MASENKQIRGTMIRPSLKRTPENASVKDAAGLPWGCALIPLAPASGSVPRPSAVDEILAEEIPRCQQCFGYINAYCMFEKKAWICSLCGSKNDLSSRYATSAVRAGLQELQRGIVDVVEECVEVDVSDIFSKELKPQERPAVVAVVDVSGSEDFVEVVKSGILALLEAIPPYVLFGLVTVSDSIGVYDMRSSFPHCLRIPVPEDGELDVAIADVLPPDCFLVQMGSNKQTITAAVESISAAGSDEHRTAPRRFALGSCLDSLFEMFEEDLQFSLRVINVIGSRPNYGLGALEEQAHTASSLTKGTAKNLPKGSEFYSSLVDRITSMSAVVDLFVIAEEGYVGVDAMIPMVECAGGTMIYYPGIDTSALPQDLYRSYSRPFASNAILRLRCSSGFQVARAYGHLSADKQYDNLYHVASCHSESCFAVDFEYDNPSGVTSNLDVQPTLQLAFSYSCIVPDPEANSFQVQRRLRIETSRVEVGRQTIDIYANADSEVMASLLCHKIIVAQSTEGTGEARMLLQDWLVILTARYNENMLRRREAALDLQFSRFPNLNSITKVVYGMLRGKLLDPVVVSRDERSFICYLCSSLTPEALTYTIYPKLVSFQDPSSSQPSAGPLFLLKSTLAKGSDKIFLLDSYTDLCIYCTAQGLESFPYPPPPDCGLRNYIQYIKDNRSICPHVYYTKAKDGTEQDFVSRLIEEPSHRAAESGPSEWVGAAAKGYDVFLEVLSTEVREFLE